MLAAALALLLAVSEAPERAPPPSPRACNHLPTLGPAGAAIELRWFFDPLAPGDRPLWFALRQLVADLEGELAIVPVIVATPTRESPTEAMIREWVAAAACNDRLELALDLLARENAVRIARDLHDTSGRQRLAARIGLDAAALDRPELTAVIDRGTHELRARQRAGRGIRPPAFAIDAGELFEDGPRLEATLRAIDTHRRRPHTAETPPQGLPKGPRRGVSDRLIRPPQDAGMMIGGIALPHRAVLLIDQEDHPDLRGLGPLLELRQRSPGWLALQVIARGSDPSAERLRLRLCAASLLGRELDYLRLLTHQATPAEAEALTQALDRATEAATCERSEVELGVSLTGARDLPSGLWLDGAALGPRELANLEREILTIEATIRPLDAVFSAAAPPGP